MNRAYLDCEFTSLDTYCELISLALVVPNGPEFYVEIEDSWVRNDCSNFVQSTVLPLLDLEKHGRPFSVATAELQAWLSQFQGLEISREPGLGRGLRFNSLVDDRWMLEALLDTQESRQAMLVTFFQAAISIGALVGGQAFDTQGVVSTLPLAGGLCMIAAAEIAIALLRRSARGNSI
jgi:hypothetical protein